MVGCSRLPRLIGLAATAMSTCFHSNAAAAGSLPLPEVSAVIRDQEQTPEPIVAHVVTDADGVFVLKDLTPGVHSVEFDRKSLAAAVAKAGGGVIARCTLVTTQVSPAPVRRGENPGSVRFACGTQEKFLDSVFVAYDKRTYRLSLTIDR
jgi:hypothetical protein